MEEVKMNVLEILHNNYDVMVYNHKDMERVSREVIKQRSNVKKEAKAMTKKEKLCNRQTKGH